MDTDKLLGKLGIVPIVDVDFGDRRREDYGEVDDLADSIKERGLMHPIVVQSDDGNAPYKLAAGGRRYLACTNLGMDEISCRIYDHPLNALDLKAIELFENLDRKNLSVKEEAFLKKDIHELMVQRHGEKTSTAPGAPGWSKRDTAKLLDKSVGGTMDDIRLAETMEAMPELGLDKCKTKNEAMKMIGKVEEGIIRKELAKRAEGQLGKGTKKLSDAYQVGDFFDLIQKVPDNCIDLVEIDPPYAIKLEDIKKSELGYKASYGDSYNEIAEDIYMDFIAAVLKHCYRVMNNHSWLIMWFGPEPWFDPMYQAIIKAGFKTRRLTAIWKKGTNPGQTYAQSMYLGSAFENFYYCRKGDANISKQGRSNIFDFDPVPPMQKIHPTERPVPLMEEILSTFTWEGSRVLVPFAGSGNTLLAADNVKMMPIGFDLSKDYKDGYVTRLLGKEVKS